MRIRPVREWGTGELLVALAASLGVLTVVVATQKNALAAGVLQAATLVFSTWGSWKLGQQASTDAGRERLKDQVRPAFRRLGSLFAALGRQKDAVTEEMERLEALAVVDNGTRYVDLELLRGSMIRLETMAIEQIATSSDALEDWRDLAPTEVAQVEARARETDV